MSREVMEALRNQLLNSQTTFTNNDILIYFFGKNKQTKRTNNYFRSFTDL